MALRFLNIMLRALLEIAALASFAWFGYRFGGASFLLSVLLAVVFALVGAALWGAFAAPKSRYRLGGTARLVFETVFFAAASAALWFVGDRPGAIVLFVLYAINGVGLRGAASTTLGAAR
jgi:Na+/melibiose symporter-like transporter